MADSRQFAAISLETIVNRPLILVDHTASTFLSRGFETAVHFVAMLAPRTSSSVQNAFRFNRI